MLDLFSHTSLILIRKAFVCFWKDNREVLKTHNALTISDKIVFGRPSGLGWQNRIIKTVSGDNYVAVAEMAFGLDGQGPVASAWRSGRETSTSRMLGQVPFIGRLGNRQITAWSRRRRVAATSIRGEIIVKVILTVVTFLVFIESPVVVTLFVSLTIIMIAVPAIAISAAVKAPVFHGVDSGGQVIVPSVKIVPISVVELVLVAVTGVLVAEVPVGAPPVPVQAPVPVPVPVAEVFPVVSVREQVI